MMIGEAIRAALAAASVLGLLQSWIQCNAFVTTPQAPPPYHASAVTNTAGMAAKTTTSTSRGSSVLRWGRPTFLEMAANGGGGGGKAGGGEKTRVLFVCLGNICRSPTAEAVFKQVTSKAGSAEKFDIDSCGTGGGSPNWYMDEGHSYHEGDSPDARMTAAAAGRGVKLGGGSRPLRPADLEEFDIIVGMDPANTEAISTAAKHWGKSDLAAAKTRTMTSYCRNSPGCKTVPDPYYGGSQGFETVLDLLDDACEGLLEKCLAGEA